MRDNAETQGVRRSLVLVSDEAERLDSCETRKSALDTFCTFSTCPSWC